MSDLGYAFRRTFTPGVYVTPAVMGRIASVFFAFALVSFTLSIIGAQILNIHYPVTVAIGLLTTCLLALGSAGLAFRGFIRSAYLSLVASSSSVQITGALLAGYGLHSPALLVGMVPLMLAYLIFPRRQVIWWVAPVLALWALIFVLHVAGYTGVDPITERPLPVNILLNMVAVLFCVISVVHLLSQQAEAAYRAVEQDAAGKARSLISETRARTDLQQFIGHLSHEIRNPIAALRNSVTLLMHPNATPAIRERSIRVVDSTSRQLLDLLNDALDSLKYGDHSFAIRQQPFDLNTVLGQLRELYQSAATEKGLELDIATVQSEWAQVIGDPQRLRQMLSNLTSNALKFTHTGHVAIRIAPPVKPGSLTWRFEVSDTGPGIAPGDQEKLFKPFSQLQQAEQQLAGGTGLGLTIVQQLAHAMRGRTGVDSQIGQGTCFWFEIELQAAGISGNTGTSDSKSVG